MSMEIGQTAEKMISVYFEIPKNFPLKKFGFFEKQDWSNCELLVIGDDLSIDDFKELYEEVLEDVSIKFFNNQEEDNFLFFAEGEFVIWLNPKEYWSDDFLVKAKDFVEQSDKRVSNVLYGVGFLKDGEKTVFAPEVFPDLNQQNKIYKNLVKPVFLSPCIKYFWKTSLIRDYKLKFSSETRKQFLKEGLFAIDYFAAVYSQNNYTEPDFDFAPLGFLLKGFEYNSSKDLKIYQQHFLDKYEIWQKNIWQKIYRVSRKLKKQS